MANSKFVYQQTMNVSINKKKLLDIARDDELDEDDLRVLLVLFTELNGWNVLERRDSTDPLNFKKVDVDAIAEILNLKKKDIKRSIRHLVEFDLLEQGGSNTVSKGYRFTF